MGEVWNRITAQSCVPSAPADRVGVAGTASVSYSNQYVRLPGRTACIVSYRCVRARTRYVVRGPVVYW